MNAPILTIVEERVDLGELTRSLGFMLRLAQVRTYDQFFRAFADADVRPGEFTVMWIVAANPGIRQGALARTLSIKPAHMTKLIERLVRGGFVRREVPPEDRRSVQLSLTDAGRAHVDHHRKRFLRVHAAEQAGLTGAEADQLLKLLHKLAFEGLSHAAEH